MTLKAIALSCSLKRSSGEPSSANKIIGLLVSELKKNGVEFTETIRVPALVAANAAHLAAALKDSPYPGIGD